MVACQTLFELEMRYMDSMCRNQLIDGVRECSDCLPMDLRDGLEEQPTDRLRLLLFAARLINALRQSRRKPGTPPRAE